MVDDGLSRFDHHLHLQRTRRQSGLLFKQIENVRQSCHLLRSSNLGLGNYEIVGELATRLVEQGGNKNIQCPDTSGAQLFVEWFDANADEWRKRSGFYAFRDFERC